VFPPYSFAKQCYFLNPGNLQTGGQFDFLDYLPFFSYYTLILSGNLLLSLTHFFLNQDSILKWLSKNVPVFERFFYNRTFFYAAHPYF